MLEDAQVRCCCGEGVLEWSGFQQTACCLATANRSSGVGEEYCFGESPSVVACDQGRSLKQPHQHHDGSGTGGRSTFKQHHHDLKPAKRKTIAQMTGKTIATAGN
jgi:hypothetical protein